MFQDEFEKIIPLCDEEISGDLPNKLEAKLTKEWEQFDL